jgi:hypothetical protein
MFLRILKEENMKKLVAIALVLVMASVASAGIGFVSSKTDVLAGETVTITLVATAVCNGFSVDALGGVGTAPAGVATLGTYNVGLTALQPGYLENGAGILIDFIAAAPSAGAIAAGANLYTFTYTVSSAATLGQTVVIAPLALGAEFFSTLDGVSYTVSNAPTADLGGVTTPIDGLTLNVIPEPMTLGLLGLGGLFLRRRLA